MQHLLDVAKICIRKTFVNSIMKGKKQSLGIHQFFLMPTTKLQKLDEIPFSTLKNAYWGHYKFLLFNFLRKSLI